MTVHVALGGASGSSAVPDFVHPARTARPELSSAESGLDAVADAIAKARRIVVVSGEFPEVCVSNGLFSEYWMEPLLVGWNVNVGGEKARGLASPPGYLTFAAARASSAHSRTPILLRCSRRARTSLTAASSPYVSFSLFSSAAACLWLFAARLTAAHLPHTHPSTPNPTHL